MHDVLVPLGHWRPSDGPVSLTPRPTPPILERVGNLARPTAPILERVGKLARPTAPILESVGRLARPTARNPREC